MAEFSGETRSTVSHRLMQLSTNNECQTTVFLHQILRRQFKDGVWGLVQICLTFFASFHYYHRHLTIFFLKTKKKNVKYMKKNHLSVRPIKRSQRQRGKSKVISRHTKSLRRNVDNFPRMVIWVGTFRLMTTNWITCTGAPVITHRYMQPCQISLML